jgi:hypothetical protein
VENAAVAKIYFCKICGTTPTPTWCTSPYPKWTCPPAPWRWFSNNIAGLQWVLAFKKSNYLFIFWFELLPTPTATWCTSTCPKWTCPPAPWRWFSLTLLPVSRGFQL